MESLDTCCVGSRSASLYCGGQTPTQPKIVLLAAFFILMLKLFGHAAAQQEQSPNCASLFWVYSTFGTTQSWHLTVGEGHNFRNFPPALLKTKTQFKKVEEDFLFYFYGRTAANKCCSPWAGGN